MRLNKTELRRLMGGVMTALRPHLRLDSLELMRMGANAVLVNRDAGVVVRVNLKLQTAEDAAARLDMVNQLADRGLPFLRPMLNRPVRIGEGLWATVWPLGSNDNPPSGAELARMLRDLHGAGWPPGLGSWLEAEIEKISSHLLAARQTAAPVEHLESIQEKLTASGAELTELFSALPPSRHRLVFGDLGANNTIVHDRQRKWIDPDTLGFGPGEIDLAVLSTYARRFQGKDAVLYRGLIAAYDQNFDQRLVDKISRLTEASSLAFLAAYWDVDPACHRELAYRLETTDPTAKWQTTREMGMQSVRSQVLVKYSQNPRRAEKLAAKTNPGPGKLPAGSSCRR